MQNFVVHKKILSVHTEDRDITKWPSSSIFAVDPPVEYKNVVSMSLADIDLPPIYVFSSANENITMNVTYIATTKTITIHEGTFTGDQLATELQGQINAAYATYPSFTDFTVEYDPTSFKFVFSNTHSFQFDFTTSTDSVFPQSFQWGLGSYLGFEKKTYTSGTNINYQVGATGTSIISPYPSSLQGEPYIYMELDLYNSMDEITPYTMRSSQMISSKHSGKHNAAFAKIPRVTGNPSYSSKQTYLNNIFFSDPPLERIQKFQFKFRYHDGRIVHFGSNFSFSIEITTLRPDSIKPPIQVQRNCYMLT